MKNKLTKISIAVIALGIQFGANAQKKYEFKFDPKSGSEYTIPMTTKITMNQMGMDIPMDIAVETHYNFADKGPDKELTFYYTKMNFNMDAMGQKISMSSDSSGAQNESLKKLVDKKVTCLIDKNGDVTKMSGMDSITSQLGDNNPMKNSLGEDAIKGVLSQSFKIYPKEKVAVGDTWKTAYDFKSGITMNSANTFTLEKVEGTTAYIKIHSDITSPAGQKINQNGMEMEMSLKGAQDGTMEIDMTTGMFKKTNVIQNLEGNVSVMGQEVPVKVKSEISATANKIK